MFACLAGQFAATGFQTGQLCLHGEQLVLTEGLDLGLELLKHRGGGS